MNGSVKGSRGNWSFVFDLPKVDGKRRQVYRRGFATKRKAEEEMRNLMTEAKGGTMVAPTRLTVGQYLTEHWLPVVENRVRPGTIDSYRKIVSRRIVPKIGGAELQLLDEPTVERWVAGLSSAGLSAKTVRNAHGVLSTALRDALRLRLVSRNVATAAQLPRLDRRAPRAWNTDEIRKFLQHVQTDRWSPMWRLFATTGLRRGEALGLRWKDVDLDAGVIAITNTRTVVTGQVVSGPPKTRAGERTIAIDGGTIAAMKAWKKVQNAERLAMGAGWPETDIVFAWPDGRLLYPQAVTKWFRALAAELGLPQIGVHGLRHTAATWMIATGVSPKLVAERMGHSNVSVTLSLYSHVLPGHDREAAEALAAAFDSPAVRNW